MAGLDPGLLQLFMHDQTEVFNLVGLVFFLSSDRAKGPQTIRAAKSNHDWPIAKGAPIPETLRTRSELLRPVGCDSVLIDSGIIAFRRTV